MKVLLLLLVCTAVTTESFNFTLDRDPDIRDEIRFTASWWDGVEASVDFLLGVHHRVHIGFLHEPSDYGEKVSDGFELTMANHNLLPEIVDPPSELIEVPEAGGSTRAIILAGSPGWVTGTLAILFPDNANDSGNISNSTLVLILPEGCPLPGNVPEIEARSNLFCVGLLPTPDLDPDTVSQEWADAQGNFSGIFTGAEISYTIPDSGGLNVKLGTFNDFYPVCLQGLREVWVFASEDSSLLGSGLSDRGVCGAPSGLLPIEERSTLFGQSCALSGPASQLGTDMRAGIRDAFAEVNYRDSSGRRRMILISMDDGYEPMFALANTVALVEQYKVVALVGATGTPTSIAVLPIVIANKIPFIGAFTGARSLRFPFTEEIVNIRSSYDDETEAMVQHILRVTGNTISLFGQNDSFGLAVRNGLELALCTRGLEIHSEGTFERNTGDISQGLATMLEFSTPDAVVMAGTAEALADFVKAARVPWPDTLFLAISFVGTSVFSEKLGIDRKDVVITQVVTVPPENQPLEWTKQEGLLVGSLLVSTLDRMTNELVTPQAVLDVIYSSGSVVLHEEEDPVGPWIRGTRGSPPCSQGISFVLVSILQLDGTLVIDNKVQLPTCGVFHGQECVLPEPDPVCDLTCPSIDPIETDTCVALLKPGDLEFELQCDGEAQPSVIECDHDLDDHFFLGLTEVCCQDTDVGTTTSCCFDVVVIDAESPPICPPDTIVCAGDDCTQELSYQVIAATSCTAVLPDDSVTEVPTEAFEASFQLGTTDITCTNPATSPIGENQCTFSITVEDCTPPHLDCPTSAANEFIGICASDGDCSRSLNVIPPEVADNCDAFGSAAVVCTEDLQGDELASDSIFPVGHTQVECISTDFSGNTATCSFPVEVQDCESPVVECVEQEGAADNSPSFWIGLPSYNKKGTQFKLSALDNCNARQSFFVREGDTRTIDESGCPKEFSLFLTGEFSSDDNGSFTTVNIKKDSKVSSYSLTDSSRSPLNPFAVVQPFSPFPANPAGDDDDVIAFIRIKNTAFVFARDEAGNEACAECVIVADDDDGLHSLPAFTSFMGFMHDKVNGFDSVH